MTCNNSLKIPQLLSILCGVKGGVICPPAASIVLVAILYSALDRTGYPRSTGDKLKLLLAAEKRKFEMATANKTKPSKRVELFILMSYDRAVNAGFRDSAWDWEDCLKR